MSAANCEGRDSRSSVFADVSNTMRARAIDLGADIVHPLYGYTKKLHILKIPILGSLQECVGILRACVCDDGGTYLPLEDAMEMPLLRAHAVVVGSAITRPHLTAKRFVDLLSGYQETERSGKEKAYK